jgi:uncharacterized protein with PIN domain
MVDRNVRELTVESTPTWQLSHSNLKFLCDEMLKRLGHWLRAAGYDVLMLPDGSADDEVVQRASEEQRILLTRDRNMAQPQDAAARLVLLDCKNLDDCAAALSAVLPVDWLYQPFSRCMNCNTPLVEASPSQWAQIPAGVHGLVTKLRYCPSCDRLYWDGSHVERMHERLARWARATRKDA